MRNARSIVTRFYLPTRTDFNEFGVFLDKAMKTGVVVAVGAQATLEKAKAGLTITKVL